MKSLVGQVRRPHLPLLVRRAPPGESPQELTFAGSQTRLGTALEGARQELAGLPLAGLVMVTDGADTTDASLSDALLALKAAGVPVFTVGVGEESLHKDIQIGRISVPRAALKGTSILVDAVVTQTRLRRRDGHARRRRRRPHRRIAGSAAAGRRRARGGARAIHRRRKPGRGSSGSRSRRGPARWSRRTTCARR